MISINLSEISVPERSKYLMAAISPRPIAFVSTISKTGVNNLAPFSFYNIFSSNPPICVFSPSRKRDLSQKDTFNNLLETGECVIHTVSHDMLHKMNLSSALFPSDADEFDISGFTPLDSVLVKPKRVKEARFQMECKLLEMKELGEQPSSGNLAICEILLIHFSGAILDSETGFINPHKLDNIARNGQSYYTRASGEAIFSLPKPSNSQVIGYEYLPNVIKDSHIYTANNLGRFAVSSNIPSENEILEFIDNYPKIESTEDDFNIYLNIKDYTKMLSVALYLYKDGNSNYKYYFEKTAQIALETLDDAFALKTALYVDLINRK